jgi:hypothetical protein
MAPAGGEEAFVFISFVPTAATGGVASRARERLTIGATQAESRPSALEAATQMERRRRARAIPGKLTLFH